MIYTYHIVLDFEMNPVPYDREHHTKGRRLVSEIIEIGAVRLSDRTFETVDEFSILVKPQMNDRIEHKITSLTGIQYEDVQDAIGYEEALAQFSEWIGGEVPARLYSWSNSDAAQIQNECQAKNIPLPDNMTDWVDFQKMFPKVTGIQTDRQLSLEYAADLAGVDFDDTSAHRALYDARVTAEIVQMVLTGAYKERMKNVSGVLRKTIETSTASMADKLGPKYKQLMAMFAEEKP